MPDKRHCDSHRCKKCWLNKLKHGNPASQAYLKMHPELVDRGYVNPNEESLLREPPVELVVEYVGPPIKNYNGDYKKWFKSKLIILLRQQHRVVLDYDFNLRVSRNSISLKTSKAHPKHYNIIILIC